MELLKGDENVEMEAVENFVSRVQNEWRREKDNLLQSVKNNRCTIIRDIGM